MLKPIEEVARKPAHAPYPHAIAGDGTRLWISSRETRRITAIDPVTWRSLGEIVPPGMPWGMTYSNGALVMTCGESDDDNRRLRRYVLDSGFEDGFLACPDDTGSHLAMFEGDVLLGQWYKRELHRLNDDGSISRTYKTLHQIAGVVALDQAAFLLGTDDEENGAYWISRLDLRDPQALPVDIALVPFRARSLAWDGRRWWTNHREAHQTVAFALPPA